MNDQLQSQNEAILERLKIGPLTSLEALEDPNIRSLRLSGRILELREEGWPIVTEIIKTASGKRIARYSLLKTDGKEVKRMLWPRIKELFEAI